jgi:NADH-quinone oxidoreductase subunit E
MTQEAIIANQASPPDPIAVDHRDILQILETHGKNRGALIAVLEEIQEHYGYLPEQALRLVSEHTNLPLVDVYGIATFYRAFSLVPRGKHMVCACLGTACHVRGASKVVDEFERQLGIQAGQTTPDGEFTLETVNCLGACALGPVAVVDGRYASKVGRSKVRQLLEQAAEGAGKSDNGDSCFPLDVSCPKCNHSLMDDSFPIDGQPSVKCSVSFGQQHGWLRLSSMYGSFNIESACEIPPETVVRFHCPHCHAQIAGRSTCSQCEAPMVPMMISGGGILQVCSRRACQNHMLNLA